MRTVGIVGGGQLARMLALAGYPLGLKFIVLDPAADACAGDVAELIVAAYDDSAALQVLAERVDCITFDFENVPAASARFLATKKPVFPPPEALFTAQDRLREKQLFVALGIATPAFAPVNTLADLVQAIAHIGLPAVLKTRRLGYDGKGQFLLKKPADLPQAFAELGDVPLIVEQFISFDKEVSLLALRATGGELSYYPLVRNWHRDGILRSSEAPFNHAQISRQAQRYGEELLLHMDYVGLLAIEFFVVGNKLLANEMAPRVHNSGHWTIEGAATSQFENHLRAGLGLPLGLTTAHGFSTMFNLIGAMADPVAVLQVRNAHWHDYGKKPRTGRKLGHVTVCGSELAQLQAVINSLSGMINP